MLALEFVECATQRIQKLYADEGKAAAVILRLTEHWQKQVPHTSFMACGLPACQHANSGCFTKEGISQHRQREVFLQEGTMGRCTSGKGST
jgi:hypothetical protein